MLSRRRFVLAAGSALVSAPLVMRRSMATTTIFRPEDPPWNAVGNGIADDAGPIQAMTAALVANGGGIVEMRPSAIYNVFSSGQVTQSVLMNIYGQRGVKIKGNGAKISFGRTWGAGDVLYGLLAQACPEMIVEDLYVVQANPVTLPFTNGSGAQVIFAQAGCKDLTLINPTCEGCIALVNTGLISGLEVINGRSTNSVYGCAIVDNETGSFSENVRLSLETDGCQRALFARGIKGFRGLVTARNTISNAILVVATTDGATVENFRLTYRSPARTSSTYPTGQDIFMGLGGSGNGTMNAAFRNVELTLDIDQTGYPSANPAVIVDKSTTGARGLKFENVRFSGSVRGIPAIASPVFDIFLPASAPWGGESARGFKFEDLLLDAVGAGPQFRVDLAPVTADSPFSFRDVSAPLIAGIVNNPGTGKLVTSNTHFASGI